MHLPDMDFKIVALGVRLGAIRTDEGTHASMDNAMSLQLPLRREAFATLYALIVVTFSFQCQLFILTTNDCHFKHTNNLCQYLLSTLIPFLG
jgi:hypothetical protein